MHKNNAGLISPHVIIGRSSRLIELALLVLVRICVLRIVITLAALLIPDSLTWRPIAAVLTVLTSSRLRAVSGIVGHNFLFVVIHEAIILLYWG